MGVLSPSLGGRGAIPISRKLLFQATGGLCLAHQSVVQITLIHIMGQCQQIPHRIVACNF